MPKPSDESFAERTEVLYNPDEIVIRVLAQNNKIKYWLDACVDVNGPSIFVIPNHPLTKSWIDMKNRGVKIRFISEVTKDNLTYCKELMKFTELRHLDDVKGNFGIGDKRVYHGGADSIKSATPPQLLISTVKSFVEQQQYFFDMLWNKAIPAKQRIKEIEEGLKREFIETIQDRLEIQNLVHKVIESATEELDVIFSTTHSFNIYKEQGVIKLLTQKADNGINIRILIENDRYDNTVNNNSMVELAKHPYIKVQYLNSSVKTKVTTFLADNELSLLVELRDDTKDISNEEAVGLATYSNSESTVLSNASIFETLWLSQSNVPIPV